MNRSVVRALIGVVVVILVLVGAGGAFFWWKVSTLKESLVRDLGHALGAHVEVTSVELDLWKGDLHIAGITLVNERPEAPWDKGAIAQATVHFHLSDLFSPSLPLSVKVSDWNVVLHSYSAGAAPADASASTPPETPDSSSSASHGHAVHVTDLTAQDGSVDIHLADNQQVALRQVSFTAGDNGAGIWTTELEAASVTAGTLMASGCSVKIRGDHDKVSFSELRMTCGQGFIGGHGDVALAAPHEANIVLKATTVPVSMLLSSPWQMKISGNVTGDVTYTGADQSASAQGHLAMDQAKFNMLPWLGKITAMVSLPDFSDVELDQATSDFLWKDHLFHFTNIDLRKNDVARIAGSVDLGAQEQIDGRLKLGFPSAVTAKWPDLQDKIFNVATDGFNWADVHVTGTPDHLDEDLTARVLAVGVQSGSDVIKNATDKASDLLKSFMGN